LAKIFENYIECKPCYGGGFTGNTGDLEEENILGFNWWRHWWIQV